ncbi:MAG TPA: zf-HC2 domain-containing protein [Bryobacteraceae bacterium]|nr:zf-HC2 domain-containing protein [Bryobacteraceae bacterium]
MSPDVRHTESDLLLQFLDGELSRRKARQVRQHVEACWQCRAKLAELHRLVTECVRYRNEVADATPPPPKAWADLSLELNRLDDSAPRISFFRRNAIRWALLGAGAASLVAATLALRVIDFHSGSERSTPEVTTPAPRKVLPEQPVSPAGTIPRADGTTPSVSGRASTPETIAEAPPASVADELQAVAALHRLGADLGEPVEVVLNGGHVVIGGTGVAPELQRQIRDAFVGAPHVVLQFSAPAVTPPAAAEPPASDAAPKPPTPGAPNPLEAQAGGRTQLERLTAQLLDHDEAAMSRVYALRRLAQQFPPEAERQLSPEDQRLLKDLGRQHVEALSVEMAAISGLASPLLAPAGASPRAASPVASWQIATQSLLVSARRVETLLPAWLGVTARDNAADLPEQLSSALAQLQADMQQCERLLKP